MHSVINSVSKESIAHIVTIALVTCIKLNKQF